MIVGLLVYIRVCVREMCDRERNKHVGRPCPTKHTEETGVLCSSSVGVEMKD